MTERTFLRAEEVARELGVSLAYAYKLIRKLNGELAKRGFITINGRINKKYFEEKLYGNNSATAKGARNERL